MEDFYTTRKFKVSPDSEYYAIEAADETFKKPPLMIVVDGLSAPQMIVPPVYSVKKEVSAIIVPTLDMIDKKFCKTVLDIIDDSSIYLYELPLVGKARGNVQSNSNIVQVFEN